MYRIRHYGSAVGQPAANKLNNSKRHIEKKRPPDPVRSCVVVCVAVRVFVITHIDFRSGFSATKCDNAPALVMHLWEQWLSPPGSWRVRFQRALLNQTVPD